MDYVHASESEKERHEHTLVKKKNTLEQTVMKVKKKKRKKQYELKESSNTNIDNEHFHSIELNANKAALKYARHRVNAVVTTKPRLYIVSSERPTLCCVAPTFRQRLRPICNTFVGSASISCLLCVNSMGFCLHDTYERPIHSNGHI